MTVFIHVVRLQYIADDAELERQAIQVSNPRGLPPVGIKMPLIVPHPFSGLSGPHPLLLELLRTRLANAGVEVLRRHEGTLGQSIEVGSGRNL